MKSMKKREQLSVRGGSNENGVTGSFCVTAGEKCKTIGWQDGSFQDFGHHLRNEMGGVWTHPVKVADGFWLSVDGAFPLADEYETLPYGTVFRYRLAGGVTLERFQFSPDSRRGLAVRYRFVNESASPRTLSLAFAVRFDVLPVWFSKECGIEDFPDEAAFDGENRCVVAKDGGHDWYGAAGWDFSEKNVAVSKEQLGPCDTIGQGVSARVDSTLTLSPGGAAEQRYFLAGSDKSREAVAAELSALREGYMALLAEKKARCQSLRARCSLRTSDPDFDQAFEWVKIDTDWLIADCGEYGRGLTAGLPEYPWWFGCDNAYATQGLLAMGDFETARDTLVLLERYSRAFNKNGRVVHEITTNGQVPNPGNSQETGHYITAVYNYWRWTGDLETVRGLYDYCAMGIEWLLTEMDPDGDLLPSGYGIIEIKGLNVELIDTAVYTCQALYRMDELAAALGKPAKSYRETADRLREILNTRLWNEEEGLFVDAVGTPAQILERIDILLDSDKERENITPAYREYLDRMQERLRALPQDEEYPFLINKNWVINTPMETGLAEPEKAVRALDIMHTPDFVGENGLYLAGFMHRHTMTISTGVQAVAEGRYGRTDEALDLLNRMFSTFSRTLPGSINEMSPDYGCFVQGWTCYAAMVPVVECMAGFQPRMQEKLLVLAPKIPQGWTAFELRSVRVGEGMVDLCFRREAGRECYRVASTGDFSIEFEPTAEGKTILVDSEPAAPGKIRFSRGETCIEIF